MLKELLAKIGIDFNKFKNEFNNLKIECRQKLHNHGTPPKQYDTSKMFYEDKVFGTNRLNSKNIQWYDLLEALEDEARAGIYNPRYEKEKHLFLTKIAESNDK